MQIDYLSNLKNTTERTHKKKALLQGLFFIRKYELF